MSWNTANHNTEKYREEEPAYKKLAKAVLHRALLDLAGYHGNTGSISRSEKDLIKTKAKIFLKRNNEMLEVWCDMADIDCYHLVDFSDELVYHLNRGTFKNRMPHMVVDRFLYKF